MEFAHLIKSPRVEKVVVRRSFQQNSVEGALCITSHHLIFSARLGDNTNELWVGKTYLLTLSSTPLYILFHLQLLHRIVDSVEKKVNQPPTPGGTLTIKCKDFNIISMDFQNTDELSNVAASLECLSSIGFKTYQSKFCISR